MTFPRFLSRIPKLYTWFGLGLVTALGIIFLQWQLISPIAAQSSVFLNGAGATFPLFLYQRWFQEYSQNHQGVQINYQAIGSAAGIQQMVSETVDFGGSDVAMTDEEMRKVDRGVVLIPMTSGSVVIAYNLPNVGSGLKLSREVYTDIFLGNIDRWSDPRIANLNPNLNLPDLPITLVHRSDGSGTTAVLTKHLSAISSQWEEKVGSGLSISWPAGVGIKSNAGVSAQIQQAQGTIGYVEYSFSQQLGLATAALQNRAGNYIQPSLEATANALDNLTLPDNLRAFVSDPEGEDAYPIVTYSWLLAYQTYDDPRKAQVLKEVILWALTEGQQYSEGLGYVPLSETVVEKATAAAETIRSR
jgi:phosphate transport system substrate-binding protein